MGIYYDPDNLSRSSWLGIISDAMYNEYLDYWGQQNHRRSPDLSPAERERFGLLVSLADAVRPCLHTLAVEPRILDRTRSVLNALGVDDASDDLASAAIAVLM